jgi:hypothetical protein
MTPPVVDLACESDELRNTGFRMLRLFATYSPPELACPYQVVRFQS